MAGMYPDNQELNIFGEKVQWPGVDSSGKFSNGSFQNPLEKPSFIPAETINLILDNLSELIKRSGGTPDNTSITQLADAIDRRFIQIFQNGYVQWTGMPSPLEDPALHFEGYSWYEVNYDGNFFRAKGRNAKAFSSKKLTKEQIKNGDYIFQDDEQGDAIRDIRGHINLLEVELANDKDNAFRHGGGGNSTGISLYQHLGVNFAASYVVPTAEENRSRNLTFTIWMLVKD
jgi:hypothetical protein